MDKKTLLLFIAVILINLIFNGLFELHYDEAYYWVWGQNLSMSYYDHPPMIAYMIRLAGIFGHGELYVRLTALVTTSITIIVIYKLALKMFDQKTADISVIFAVSCPLMQGMFFVVTPDSPLLMFWSLTLYTMYCGIFEKNTKFIYLSGFFAGCTLLSKYTGILIFPSIFLFLIFSREYRYLLARKDLYIAFIMAIVIFSPVILWNYQHEWASFAFQLHHGVNKEATVIWESFGDFWGGAALVVSPIIYIAMLYYSLRYLKVNLLDPRLSFLFWSFAFGLIFFAYCSLYKHTEANWPAPVYLSAMIIVARWVSITNNKLVYRSSVVFIFFVLLIAKFPLVFTPSNLHNKVPGLNIFYGNKELLNHVKPYLNNNTYLLACDYGNASRAWYYLNLDRVYVLHKMTFSNEFRYLDSGLGAPIKRAIYICDSEDIIAEAVLKKYFNTVKLVEYVTYSNVITDNKIYIYQVFN